MRRLRIETYAAGLAVGLAASTAWAQSPLRTALTYQGQLKQAGVPLTDTADLEFSLWDDAGSGHPPTGGNQIGSTVRVNDVAVTNGLFTVEVDFGVGAFTGEDARWLQIALRRPHDPGDIEPFTTLNPRQSLTAPPHSAAAYTGGAALHGHVAGRVGLLSYEDCLSNESGFSCSERSAISVAVHEGQEVTLEVVDLWTPQGEPEERTSHIVLKKQPRSGVPAAGAFDVGVSLTGDSRPLHFFTLSPDDPVYRVEQSGAGWQIHARLVTDDLVVLRMSSVATLKVVETESLGIIDDAHVEPYAATDRLARARVTIQNYGDLRTNYIATVTDCPSHIAPVVAQYFYLDQYDPNDLPTATLDFTLRTDEPLTGDEECTVRLKSPTGRLYDEDVLDFPAPTKGAQAPWEHDPPEATSGLATAAPFDAGDRQRRAGVSAIKARSAESKTLGAPTASRQGRIEALKERLAELETVLETLLNKKQEVTP